MLIEDSLSLTTMSSDPCADGPYGADPALLLKEEPALSFSHKMVQYRMAVVAACLLSIILVGNNAVAGEKFNITLSERVSAKIVSSLYKDKTWQWADGAGYFGKDGKFTAYAGEGDNVSYGNGRWEVSRHGILCFYSRWYAANGSSRATKCFEHRNFSGDIYQLVSKSRNWYLFKHRLTHPKDEFLKLKRGNLIEEKLSKIQSKVDKSLSIKKKKNRIRKKKKRRKRARRRNRSR